MDVESPSPATRRSRRRPTPELDDPFMAVGEEDDDIIIPRRSSRRRGTDGTTGIGPNSGPQPKKQKTNFTAIRDDGGQPQNDRASPYLRRPLRSSTSGPSSSSSSRDRVTGLRRPPLSTSSPAEVDSDVDLFADEVSIASSPGLSAPAVVSRPGTPRPNPDTPPVEVLMNRLDVDMEPLFAARSPPLANPFASPNRRRSRALPQAGAPMDGLGWDPVEGEILQGTGETDAQSETDAVEGSPPGVGDETLAMIEQMDQMGEDEALARRLHAQLNDSLSPTAGLTRRRLSRQDSPSISRGLSRQPTWRMDAGIGAQARARGTRRAAADTMLTNEEFVDTFVDDDYEEIVVDATRHPPRVTRNATRRSQARMPVDSGASSPRVPVVLGATIRRRRQMQEAQEAIDHQVARLRHGGRAVFPLPASVDGHSDSDSEEAPVHAGGRRRHNARLHSPPPRRPPRNGAVVPQANPGPARRGPRAGRPAGVRRNPRFPMDAGLFGGAQGEGLPGYEVLLQLAEQLGEAGGLTEAEIGTLPSAEAKGGEESEACAVCMSDFEAGERLRLLPCAHRFHQPCLDTWLKERNTCPICRSQPLENRRGGAHQDFDFPHIFLT